MGDNMGPESKPVSPSDSDKEYALQEMTVHEKIDLLKQKESELAQKEALYEEMLQENIMMERRLREMQEKKARTEASSSHTRENDDEERFTNFMNLVQHSVEEQILQVGENLRAELRHEREDLTGRVPVFSSSVSTCAATLVSDVPCTLLVSSDSVVSNDAPLREQVSAGEFSSAVHAVSVNASSPLGTFPPFTPGLAMPLAAASVSAPMFSTRISAGSVPQNAVVSPSQVLPGTQPYIPTVSSGYLRPVSVPFGQGEPSVMSGSSSQFSSGQTINAGQFAFPSSYVPYNVPAGVSFTNTNAAAENLGPDRFRNVPFAASRPAGPVAQQVRPNAAVFPSAAMYGAQLNQTVSQFPSMLAQGPQFPSSNGANMRSAQPPLQFLPKYDAS
jgi:hypothetical protein